MKVKVDIGISTKIINGKDAIELLKVMIRNIKICEVSLLLIKLIDSDININLVIKAVKEVSYIFPVIRRIRT